MTCPSCAGRSDDGLLCKRETLAMTDNLGTIIDLWAELEITLTRQTKIGSGQFNGKHTKAKTKPLPFDKRASMEGKDIRDILASWIRVFRHPQDPMPRDRTPLIALWLRTNADTRIRAHADAPFFIKDLPDIIDRIRRVIDLRPESLYLGPCKNRIDDAAICKHQMYANPHHEAYECPGEIGVPCGAIYNVKERQAEMLVLGRDMHATIGQCAAWLARFGLQTPIRTIESWTRSRPSKNGVTYPARVWPSGMNGDDVRLYRLGDMEELARERAAKKAEPNNQATARLVDSAH